jgi:hypothetical protein
VAVEFPSNPVNGATAQVGNTVFVYNAARGIWDSAPVTPANREAAILQNVNLLTINKLILASK